MEREELIEKINRQAGYVDVLDAYKLVHVYVNLFGDDLDTKKKPVSIEDQLAIMWDRIKRYEDIVTKNDYVDATKTTKVCYTCSNEFLLTEFHRDRKKKDGYKLDCKACAVKKHNDWTANRLLVDPDYHRRNRRRYREGEVSKKSKVCRDCMVEYDLECFHTTTRNKDGRISYCKLCANKRRMDAYEKNKNEQ